MAKEKVNLTLDRMAQEGKRAAGFLVGMLVGTQVLKAIDRRSGGMAGVMGLDGESRRMLAPSVTAVIGLGISAMSKDANLRNVGYGVASTGGAVMVQEATGMQLLPATSAMMPASPGTPRYVQGVGYAMDELPEPTVSGLGEPTYVDEEGNIYDQDYNRINGLEGEEGEEDGVLDTDEDGVEGVDGDEDEDEIIEEDDDGVEGVDGDDGFIPGIGSANGSEDFIPGIGGTDGLPNYGTV